MNKKSIFGVVLAGGQSSRMKQDKALLDYNGRPLLDHMIDLMQQVGFSDVYVSGNVQNYNCIPDTSQYAGPARAMYDVLQHLGDYDGVLFIPVDMPLLPAGALQLLMKQETSGHFTDFPLPAYITSQCPSQPPESVKTFLESVGGQSIALPHRFVNGMKNANTPEQWEEVMRT